MNYFELQILIDNELRENWNYFDSFEDIGYKIFNKLYENKPLETFDEKRNDFINTYDEPDYPNNEKEFYEKFCHDFCNVDTIPKNVFIDKYIDAIYRLTIIENHIKVCKKKQKELMEQKKINNILTAEQKYNNKRIEYYLNENQKEKNNIIDFITHDIIDSSIKGRHLLGGILNFPDNLFNDFRLSRLDYNNYSPVSNKFGDLPLPEYRKVIKMHKTDIDSFKNYLKAYIKDNDIIEQIRNEVIKNHILSNKKESINKSLNEYNNNNYFVFNNLIPLFIEGIFNDVCISLGVPQTELDCSSLNEKLDAINERISFFFLYEYFAFTFPVFRNKTAHGDLENSEDEYFANFLLLDLYSVFQFTNSDELIFNKNLKKINEIYTYDNQKLFQLYISDTDIINFEIDEFYENELKKLDEIKKRLFSIDFANYLLSNTYIKQRGKFFEIIKKQNPSIKDEVNIIKCKALHIPLEV